MQAERLKTLKRSDAANENEVSVRTINRWMKKAGIKRDPSKTRLKKEAAKARKTDKRSAALLVHKRQISVEQAAVKANCSTRTIYRYLKRLKALLGEPDV